MMKWDFTMERHMRIMKKEEREEGRQEGRQEGDTLRLINQIQKKMVKGKSITVIADELETDEKEIRPYYEEIVLLGADCDAQEILDHIGTFEHQQDGNKWTAVGGIKKTEEFL